MSSTTPTAASTQQPPKGMWSMVAPHIIPSVTASAAIVPVFLDMVAKNAQQKGQAVPAMPLMETVKVTPTVGTIIRNYNPQTDREAIFDLAKAHIEYLASVDKRPLTDQGRIELVNKAVVPAFEALGISKHVAIRDGKLVGFITYGMKPKTIYGTIHHLAVQTELQKAQIGSSLLRGCLSDLRSSGVQFAHLKTTKEEPIPFYRKHGFCELKPIDIKDGCPGIMGINMREGSVSFRVHCLDYLRLRRPISSQIVKGAGSLGLMLGIVSALPRLMPAPKKET